MTSPENRRRHWRRNLLAVFLLLSLWFVVTFGVAYFGRELGSVAFFGWPFSYWVGAQGALLVYLIIVVVYARYMNRLDRRFGTPAAVDTPTSGASSDNVSGD